MTSDAKIGLLLGLVFIFAIAFIINGLPSFREDKNSNELTTSMASLDNNPPGLAAKERKVGREVTTRTGPVRKQVIDEVQTPPTAVNQDIRFTMSLPKSTQVAEEIVKVEPKKPTLPKVYVVNEDDCLAVIAKKFYGPQQGNKMINVTRIFEANREVLSSPDEIYVGQKLIIPPLTGSRRIKNKVKTIFSTTEFVKIESIGKRLLSADILKASKVGQYVVREGDSLWRIAAEQLGDGSRYDEIAELNAGILDDEDSLAIGMRLKLSAR